MGRTVTPLLTVSGLTVSYPGAGRRTLLGPAPRVTVLHALSFDLMRGSVTGIVGESGSGKSTLGRAVLRLLEPDAGRILFDGIDLTHLQEPALRPLRARFQMIFQDPMSSLNPRHSLRRLIASPLQIRGVADAEVRAAEALDMVGLPAAFLDRYPHELSGGQRQRVGIARAVAQRPDLIIADEIASGLDVSTQAQVLTLLRGLVGELELTLALISHDLSVVRRLCDTVVVMQAGRLVETAPTGRLFDAPESDYTRMLLSAIPLPVVDQPGW